MDFTKQAQEITDSVLEQAQIKNLASFAYSLGYLEGNSEYQQSKLISYTA